MKFIRASRSQSSALVGPINQLHEIQLNSPGKMGTAVLSGILAHRNTATQAPITKFIACVQSSSSAERLRSTFQQHLDCVTVLEDDNLRAFQAADILLLACKPYMAAAVLGATGVRDALKWKFLISVLAGSPPARLDEFIYGDWPTTTPKQREVEGRCYMTRATPNMAASLGSSMTIIEASDPPPPQNLVGVATWIFQQVGAVRYVAPSVFDCGSALTGAGIAFMTVAVDGLLDGAVAEGMKRVEAKEMLAETLRGMADLLAAGEHPAVLREAISSPRGTTIRGLLALEAGNVRSSFSRAIMDATDRAREM
jgi:pyrroline-5-carboxylate reductase